MGPSSDKTLAQLISAIYLSKIKDDIANMRMNKMPQEMPEFVFSHFCDEFGLPVIRDKVIVEFMAIVVAYQDNPEVLFSHNPM